MTHLLSIILSTYNRSADLKIMLESLLAQEKDSSFEFEIILIDNNSSDDTKEIVKSFETQFGNKLHYIFQPIPGKCLSINIGIEKSKGDIIVFTDDDVVLHPSWLKNISKFFQLNACDGIGGRVLPIYNEDVPAWVKQNPRQAAGGVVIYDQGEHSFQINNNTERFIGCNWAFKRTVFNDCGNFNTKLGPGTPVMMGEDEDFFERVRQSKKILFYCAQALVHHPVSLKRLALPFVAKWHMALGRYEAIKEIENNPSLVYCFGVPRYLIRGLIIDIIKLLTTVFNHLAFFTAWRSLFRKIGMIQQYRLTFKTQ